MGTFATTTFVWVCALAATALDQDCIGLLEWRARFSRTRGDAVSISTESLASFRSTRICDSFQERNTIENQHGQWRQRMLQDTSCPMELLQSVQGDADGFLSLNEYSLFFTSRYYRRCDVGEIDIDASNGLSIAQVETFKSLSCLICLGEMPPPVSSLPDCCMAQNARISVNHPLVSTFTRICNEARATAIDDCGYAAIIETTSPRPGIPPHQRPSLGEPPSDRPIMVPQLQQSEQTCIRGLAEADTQVPDGLLNQNEFMSFLDSQFGSICVTNISSEISDGVFRQLACAWCLSGSGASLECCSGSAARIAITEAVDTENTVNRSAWLQRVCSTIHDEIGKSCEAGKIHTRIPISPVQPQTAPTSVPVLRKTEPPLPISPVQAPALQESFGPMAYPPIQQPAPNSQEEPTTVGADQTPTPDPTLRPPPGDPGSTVAPINKVEPTSVPLSGGSNAFVPTESTTLTPTKSVAKPPVPPIAVEPPNGDPTGQQSSTTAKVSYFYICATLFFSVFCC